MFLAPAKLRALDKEWSLPYALRRALAEAGIEDIVEKGSIVAVKVHVGDLELGGFRYVRPHIVRVVVDYIKSLGAMPFLTDTWGLPHVYTGLTNGFNYATLGAPLIPVSGIRESFIVKVRVPRPYRLLEVGVGGNVYDADVLVNLAHAKGHPSSGYGGAIKNLAMGCTSPEVRSYIHTLERLDDEGRAFQEAMVDAASAVLLNKAGRVLHVNYILDVTPSCDCAPWSDLPVVPDLGVAVSRDIVALEEATLRLIDAAPSLPGSVADQLGLKPGDNKFKAIHGKDPYIQVVAAERIGLGSRRYKLVEVVPRG